MSIRNKIMILLLSIFIFSCSNEPGDSNKQETQSLKDITSQSDTLQIDDNVSS
jgi:hypothetical protein